jgi:hypothetical protein
MNTVCRIDGISMTIGLKPDLREITTGFPDDKIFMLFESNTWKHCWPLIRNFRPVPE